MEVAQAVAVMMTAIWIRESLERFVTPRFLSDATFCIFSCWHWENFPHKMFYSLFANIQFWQENICVCVAKKLGVIGRCCLRHKASWTPDGALVSNLTCDWSMEGRTIDLLETTLLLILTCPKLTRCAIGALLHQHRAWKLIQQIKAAFDRKRSLRLWLIDDGAHNSASSFSLSFHVLRAQLTDTGWCRLYLLRGILCRLFVVVWCLQVRDFVVSVSFLWRYFWVLYMWQVPLCLARLSLSRYKFCVG